MKNIVFLLLLVIPAVVFSQQTDWEKEGLKGRVKQVTKIEYEVNNEKGDKQKSINLQQSKNFNSEGKIINIFEIDKFGTLKQKLKINYNSFGDTLELYFNNMIELHREYNERGKLLLEIKYMSNENQVNQMLSKTEYIYDEFNNLLLVKDYNTNTNDIRKLEKYLFTNEHLIKKEILNYDNGLKLNSKEVFIYDIEKILEINSFDANDVLTGKKVYKYNPQGQIVEEEDIGINTEYGNIVNKTIYKYNKQFKLEEVWFTDESGNESNGYLDWINKFDDNGNIIVSKQLDNHDIQLYGSEFVYDKNSNLIEERGFWREFSSKINYRFNNINKLFEKVEIQFLGNADSTDYGPITNSTVSKYLYYEGFYIEDILSQYSYWEEIGYLERCSYRYDLSVDEKKRLNKLYQMVKSQPNKLLFFSKIINKYSNSSLLLTSEHFDKNNNIIFKHINKYDDFNNLTEEKKYDIVYTKGKQVEVLKQLTEWQYEYYEDNSKLQKAIILALSTPIGKELKPYLEYLRDKDKIVLYEADLNDGGSAHGYFDEAKIEKDANKNEYLYLR